MNESVQPQHQNMQNIGQPIYEDYPYGAPDPGASLSNEQFKYLLNNDDTIVELEKYLRGIEYDPEREKWVKMRVAVMNEQGINAVISTCKLRCSRGFNLGVFHQLEIKEMIRNFAIDLNKLLNTEYKNFNLKTIFIPIVYDNIVDIVWANLTRTEGGWQQKVIAKIWRGGEMSRPSYNEADFNSPHQGKIGRTISRLIG